MDVALVPNHDDKFNYEVKLSKSGRVFSNSHREGTLKTFRYLAGSIPEIYFSCGGDYLQLFPAPEIGGFVGNFYEENEVRELKPSGRVTLRRIR